MLILFFIYISEVFNLIIKTNTLVISLSFFNNLGFIALGSSVKKLVKTFENIAKKIIKWGKLNAIIYEMSKTEAIFFPKSQ